MSRLQDSGGSDIHSVLNSDLWVGNSGMEFSGSSNVMCDVRGAGRDNGLRVALWPASFHSNKKKFFVNVGGETGILIPLLVTVKMGTC